MEKKNPSSVLVLHKTRTRINSDLVLVSSWPPEHVRLYEMSGLRSLVGTHMSYVHIDLCYSSQ